HAQRMRAVMDARYFAELQRVERQACIAMRREPTGAILIMKLGAQGMRYVPAKVEYRRERMSGLLRYVEIASDVKTGHALKSHILDAIARAIQRARDLHVQRRAGWQQDPTH